MHTQAYRELQLSRMQAAIAECDREHTQDELARAEAALAASARSERGVRQQAIDFAGAVA